MRATEDPPVESRARIEREGDTRRIESNGIPDHRVGAFPNRGNPHKISAQNYDYRLPANPKPGREITPLHASATSGRGAGPPNMPFGIALNGVLFDPGTAEFWNGDRAADWNYEALGGAVGLGVDENHAHVQPNGAYHYHGLPTFYLKERGVAPDKHSPLIGWAADGFPIYALYGYENSKDPTSKIVVLGSSYRLKDGSRPAPPEGPGGKRDGAFTRDYEFVAGAGDLDECNGRFGVTPDFPDGTYAYFLTENWPVIPRAVRGTPIQLRGGGAGRRGPGQGPPGGARPPPPR